MSDNQIEQKLNNKNPNCSLNSSITSKFATEKELINKFCFFFQKYKLKKEVKTSKWTITDIVLYTNNTTIAFEAKLNNIIEVWVQALRNKSLYDYSYVVLPLYKKNLIMKNFDIFQKHKIGIILVSKAKFEFLNKIENFL